MPLNNDPNNPFAEFSQNVKTARSAGLLPPDAERALEALGKDLKEKKRLDTNNKQAGFFNTFQKFSGIRITTANLLRQSQILNRFVGSLFQVLGGAIDLFLAPLAPLLKDLFPAITQFYPLIRDVGELFAFWLGKIGETLDSLRGLLPDQIQSVIKNENLVLLGGITATLLVFRGPIFRMLATLTSLLISSKQIEQLTRINTATKSVTGGTGVAGLTRSRLLRGGLFAGGLGASLYGINSINEAEEGDEQQGLRTVGTALTTLGAIGFLTGNPAGFAVGGAGIVSGLIINAIADGLSRSARDTTVTLRPPVDPDSSELQGARNERFASYGSSYTTLQFGG